MKDSRLPTVFIGSSTEGLEVGQAIERSIIDVANVQTWTTAFEPSGVTLDTILRQAGKADFGIFVVSPDDTARIRKTPYSIVRDNVIFEAGVFMGTLGRERTFLFLPGRTAKPMRLPTDLLGLTYVVYPRARPGMRLNLVRAVAPVKRRIRDLGPALRSAYSEMSQLKRSLAEHEHILADDSTVSIMEVIRPAAKRRRRPWYRGTPVWQLCAAMEMRWKDDIVDDTFWWLVIYGVITFDNIHVWVDEGWHWLDAIEHSMFTERGVALLNEIR